MKCQSKKDSLNPEDYHLSTLLIQKLHLEQGKSPEPLLVVDYDILLTDA